MNKEERLSRIFILKHIRKLGEFTLNKINFLKMALATYQSFEVYLIQYDSVFIIFTLLKKLFQKLNIQVEGFKDIINVI